MYAANVFPTLSFLLYFLKWIFHVVKFNLFLPFSYLLFMSYLEMFSSPKDHINIHWFFFWFLGSFIFFHLKSYKLSKIYYVILGELGS